VLDQHSRGTLLQLPGENLSYPLVDENSQNTSPKLLLMISLNPSLRFNFWLCAML
jgi:hypothetical protein